MGIEMLQAECIYPAPMVSETERQKRLEQYRIGVWARGYIIEKEWRVHNPVFDKKGEKTTTKMLIHPAKTEDEMQFILSKLESVSPE